MIRMMSSTQISGDVRFGRAGRGVIWVGVAVGWLLAVAGAPALAGHAQSANGAQKPPAAAEVTDDEQQEKEALPPLSLTRCEVTTASFNPYVGETCGVVFYLSRPAAVTCQVNGPNGEQVAALAQNKELPAGRQVLTWDGRDRQGNIVPDEAWFFTLQAVAGEEAVAIDPELTSGKERIVAQDFRSFGDGTRLSYKLPRACRVLVRAGVVEGPLINTVVNWEPRTAGLALEYWDGKDQQDLRTFQQIQDVKLAVFAYSLPDLTVLSTGSPEPGGYAKYYENTAKQWPHKAKVTRSDIGRSVLSPYAGLPPHLSHDPALVLTFPEIDGKEEGDPAKPTTATDAPPAAAEPVPTKVAPAEAAPPAKPGASGENAPAIRPAETGDTEKSRTPQTISPSDGEAAPDAAAEAAVSNATRVTGDTVLVRVDIPDDLERAFMNNQRFEVIIYVDDRRVLEVEQGHVPFTYPWDISSLSAGRHVLTINVASFRNHVGTVSRLVDVER
jgi:hypothetical protein